ncbi:hypothetical protein TcWFU_010461 [Taenia crassiceps]|uniref:Uncharacterized protein n=1 Tax=Taenia crassiceps TaxID=6207 RepID=A0ABR4Q7D8_9CEST
MSSFFSSRNDCFIAFSVSAPRQSLHGEMGGGVNGGNEASMLHHVPPSCYEEVSEDRNDRQLECSLAWLTVRNAVRPQTDPCTDCSCIPPAPLLHRALPMVLLHPLCFPTWHCCKSAVVGASGLVGLGGKGEMREDGEKEVKVEVEVEEEEDDVMELTSAVAFVFTPHCICHLLVSTVENDDVHVEVAVMLSWVHPRSTVGTFSHSSSGKLAVHWHFPTSLFLPLSLSLSLVRV